jgi:hypothetical protein
MRAEASGTPDEAERIGRDVGADLLGQGADRILAALAE